MPERRFNLDEVCQMISKDVLAFKNKVLNILTTEIEKLEALKIAGKENEEVYSYIEGKIEKIRKKIIGLAT